MNSHNALQVEDLGLRYGSVPVLAECSFAIPRGSVAALVGPNGAGKTTLMNAICGLLRPYGGRITIGDGSGRVAYVAQEKPLYGNFRVEEMLTFGRHTNLVWDQQRALSWLNAFEVPLRRRCAKLSGGQRAQVALAVALGSRPDLLLLDEPLANLDPLARTDVIRELLTTVVDDGATVLLSTHIVAELHGLSDHLVTVNRGRIVLTGDVDDLLAQHALFLGPPSGIPPRAEKIISRSDSARQSTILARLAPDAAQTLLPARWRQQDVALEELILAYLRPDAPIAAERAHVGVPEVAHG